MEEIKNILRSMQDEMKQQKVEMLDMKEEIKNTIISNMNEKFQGLELKTELLEQQLESQKKKIDNMERLMRKKNLLFFGVEEREKSYQDLLKTVLEIINKYLIIECNENSVEFVRRLGRRGENLRPIVVTLSTMGLKIKLLKNKKKLASTPFYIKEDFPQEILKKRKELQIELHKARESGNRAFIKYDRLVLLGTKHKQKENDVPNNQIEREKKDKKRNSSESPESLRGSNNSGYKKQSTKIIKNNNMTSYLIKKPTLTLHGSHSQLTPEQENKKTTQ